MGLARCQRGSRGVTGAGDAGASAGATVVGPTGTTGTTGEMAGGTTGVTVGTTSGTTGKPPLSAPGVQHHEHLRHSASGSGRGIAADAILQHCLSVLLSPVT